MWIKSFDEKETIDAKSFELRRTDGEKPEWELIGRTEPAADGSAKTAVYNRFDNEDAALSALKETIFISEDEERRLSALFGNKFKV